MKHDVVIGPNAGQCKPPEEVRFGKNLQNQLAIECQVLILLLAHRGHQRMTSSVLPVCAAFGLYCWLTMYKTLCASIRLQNRVWGDVFNARSIRSMASMIPWCLKNPCSSVLSIECNLLSLELILAIIKQECPCCGWCYLQATTSCFSGFVPLCILHLCCRVQLSEFWCVYAVFLC